MDPNLPVGEVRTMEAVAGVAVARPRMNMLLLGVFAAMALLLAAIGIYGIISYAVTQRTREIGVRLALGAAPASVVRLMVGRGMVLAGLGLAIGLLAAVAATRVMSSLLFGVGATDPATLAAVTAFLAALALAASWFPALRATRVDPSTTLRAE
jgi:putative ABC transport system permease protein